MLDQSINIYEREKLYNEVWSSPVVEVAKVYGVSNVAIKKQCILMNIPTPPNGYWAALRAGKKVHQAPLPPAKKGQEVRYGTDHNAQKKKKDDPISFLNAQERENLYLVAQSLQINPNSEICHELRSHQRLIERWNKDNSSIEGLHCSYTDYKYRNTEITKEEIKRPPVLAGVISTEALSRVYKILNSIISGIKQLGYSVNEDMTFQIREERVEFYIYEKQSYFDHVATAAEIKQKEKYEKDRKRDRWAHEPYIPTEDYRFNGRLLFSTKKATYIQDTDKDIIEDRLNDMLIQLFQQSEIVKIERIKREEEQRKRNEEKRQRDLPLVTYNSEVDKLKSLLDEVKDFELAAKIRDYANYVRYRDTKHKKTDWISWAYNKAAWYDPTINKSDNILGIRDHSSGPIPDKKGIQRY